MKKHFFLITVVFAVNLVSISQNIIELDSRKIITKGVELHDKGKFTEAIAEFKKVNRNDTNFVLANLELINSYTANHQDTSALLICEKLKDVTSGYEPKIILQTANVLDNLKRTDEAIKLYEKGIQKFPLYNLLYFELATLNYNQKKYFESHQNLVKAIKYNPYHAGSHYLMANLALKQGKVVAAILAFQYFLLLENDTDRSLNVVNALDQLAKYEIDLDSLVEIDQLKQEDDFSEVESLVKSLVAIDKKYKSKIKLNFNFTKQQQLILEKIEFNEQDKGFYMNFYVPIFKTLFKNNYYEPFANLVLAGANIEMVNGYLKSHKEPVDQFIKWFLEYLGTSASTFDAELNGKKVKARHWYSNSKLRSIGNVDANGNEIGYWNYLSDFAKLVSEGSYDQNSKREGLWKFYYEDGRLKGTENYKNGLLNGLTEEFYSNGALQSKLNYLNGEMDGLQKTFYPSGALNYEFEYKSGKANGFFKSYFENGSLESEASKLNGKFEGPIVEYYSDGTVKERYSCKEGKRTGKFQSFYNTPANTLQYESTYENGIEIGEFKRFYRNGKIEASGSLGLNELKEGTWKTFFKNGVLKSEEYYEKGKETGTSKNYDKEGRLLEEFVYKNDMLQEYKAYDLSGKIINQNKKEGKGNYNAVLYYPNGNIKREGKVLNFKLTGVWKNYNQNGVIESETNYVNGNKEGKEIHYFDNGGIKSESYFVNGINEGSYKEYHKNRKLKIEGNIVNDLSEGQWLSFYSNGFLGAEEFYLKGKLEGWQKYFAINGKLQSEEFYEFNYLTKKILYDSTGKITNSFEFALGSGVFETKFKNGKTNIKYALKNGKIDGPINGYFPDGSIRLSKELNSGVYIGDIKEYYPNGKISFSEKRVNGDAHGLSTNYSFNGILESEFLYEYGSLNGKSNYYHSNGKISKDYYYNESLLDGNSSLYAENGELQIQRIYQNDVLTSYTYHGKNGELVPPIKVVNETADIKGYFKSGLLAIEYKLKAGLLEGNRNIYHSNGKLAKVDFFINDMSNGVSKEFYESGKLRKQEFYIDDQIHGPSITYFENGNIQSEIQYRNGSLHGTYKLYDSSGKLIKALRYYDNELLDEL